MKLDVLRKLIREEIRTAIKEELKDILTEAVVIASTPETKTQVQKFDSHKKIESIQKPKFSEIMSERNKITSTGDPLIDLLNETAQAGEWRSLNGEYNAANAVNWAGGMPGMGNTNVSVVASVDQMISQQGPVRDINDVRIDAVPDFTGLMSKLKENGKL